jgi:hypothetical protein
MSEVRGALIRVTPEAMTKLLRLPDGHRVLRFQLLAGVLHCLATGPILPELFPGTEPQIITPDEVTDRKAKLSADGA